MPGLKEIVNSLSADEVRHIEGKLGLKKPKTPAYWQIPQSPFHRVVSELLDTKRLKETVGELSTSEKKILQYLINHGGELKEEELRSVSARAEADIANLKRQFILFENPHLKRKAGWDVLSLPVEFQNSLSSLQTEKHTLGFLLQNQTSEYYPRLASQFKLERSSGSRTYITLQLREKLLQPDFLKSCVAELGKAEKKILSSALEMDGILSRNEIADTGLVKEATLQQMDVRYQSEGPLLTLYLKALLFPSSLYHPAHFIIAREVVSILNPPAKKTAPLIPSPETPQLLVSFGSRILNDTRMLRAYDESGRLKSTRQGHADKKALAQFFDRLGVKDLRYASFVYGLTQFGEGRANSISTYFKNPTRYFIHMIDQWKETRWHEESDSGSNSGSKRHSYDTDSTLPAKRNLMLKGLAALPDEKWVKSSEFINHDLALGWRRTEAQLARDRYGSYDYGHTGRLTSAETLRVMIMEPLLWLGLIEVGMTGDGDDLKLSHIKLTRWGRFVANEESGAFPDFIPMSLVTQVLVQPNNEIVVEPALDQDVLCELFKIAEVKGPHTLVLTKESIRQALAAELSSKQILATLASYSKNGVPENVERFVLDISKQHGRIKLGPAEGYLTVDDPALLSELKSNPDLKKYFGEQLGDRVVLISYYDISKLDRLLKKAGHLPLTQKSWRD